MSSIILKEEEMEPAYAGLPRSLKIDPAYAGGHPIS